jgi:hypothetical protein
VKGRIAQFVLEVPVSLFHAKEVFNILQTSIFAGSEDSVSERRHVGGRMVGVGMRRVSGRGLGRRVVSEALRKRGPVSRSE